MDIHGLDPLFDGRRKMEDGRLKTEDRNQKFSEGMYGGVLGVVSLRMLKNARMQGSRNPGE